MSYLSTCKFEYQNRNKRNYVWCHYNLCRCHHEAAYINECAIHANSISPINIGTYFNNRLYCDIFLIREPAGQLSTLSAIASPTSEVGLEQQKGPSDSVSDIERNVADEALSRVKSTSVSGMQNLFRTLSQALYE